jgi:adenylate cyclase
MAAGSSNPTLPDRPSIAVLPFQNISADPEQEYFADGMADEIITALSRFPSLFVIARNSSFTYKGRAVDVKQVARELGVRYVLEGSVRKAGNRVRFHRAAHRCDNRRKHLGGPLRWCPGGRI